MTQKKLKAGNDYTESQKSIASECTYGKGINPEGVEKMYDTLNYIDTYYGEATKLSAMIKEALTAAKL
jgi:hypothetical protein